jgi:hypothetical protein
MEESGETVKWGENEVHSHWKEELDLYSVKLKFQLQIAKQTLQWVELCGGRITSWHL